MSHLTLLVHCYAFQVGRHPDHKENCFFLVRTDGTEEDFSYRKCIDHAFDIISPDKVKTRSKSNNVAQSPAMGMAQSLFGVQKTNNDWLHETAYHVISCRNNDCEWDSPSFFLALPLKVLRLEQRLGIFSGSTNGKAFKGYPFQCCILFSLIYVYWYCTTQCQPFICHALFNCVITSLLHRCQVQDMIFQMCCRRWSNKTCCRLSYSNKSKIAIFQYHS